MRPISTPDRATFGCTPPTGGIWSPPASLLEIASGDDDLITELIQAFRSDAMGRIQRIQGAVAAGDFSRIRAEAHAIKGSARQVGADAVADRCQELERVAQAGNASLAAELWFRVQEALEDAYFGMALYCGTRGIDIGGRRSENEPT